MFELHAQLRQDCHVLGRIKNGYLLLHRNAAVTWFILVPETDAVDLLDLPAPELTRIMSDCQELSRYLKQTQKNPKVNFGALGNLVPQLHLHVVGRSPDDPCWPQPVWGNLSVKESYDEPAVAAIVEYFVEHCALQPVD